MNFQKKITTDINSRAYYVDRIFIFDLNTSEIQKKGVTRIGEPAFPSEGPDFFYWGPGFPFGGPGFPNGGPGFPRRGTPFLSCAIELSDKDSFAAPLKGELRGVFRLKIRV